MWTGLTTLHIKYILTSSYLFLIKIRLNKLTVPKAPSPSFESILSLWRGNSATEVFSSLFFNAESTSCGVGDWKPFSISIVIYIIHNICIYNFSIHTMLSSLNALKRIARFSPLYCFKIHADFWKVTGKHIHWLKKNANIRSLPSLMVYCFSPCCLCCLLCWT